MSTRREPEGRPSKRTKRQPPPQKSTKKVSKKKAALVAAAAGYAATNQPPPPEEPPNKKRKRRREDPEADEIKLDMTPLIDCVFLLLIFFMCATKFKTVEDRFDANLPQDEGLESTMKPEDKEKPEPCSIGILDDDEAAKQSTDYIVKYEREATFVINAKRRIPPGPTQSQEMFTILKALPDKTEIHIYPYRNKPSARDHDIPFKEIIRLMDICYEAEKTDIRFRPPVN